MPRWANRRTQEMGKTKNGHQGVRFLFDAGVPTGIRTPVTAVKGRCPRPLDDGDPVLGGGKRDRTADLLHAMQALSQLSYTPEELRILFALMQFVNGFVFFFAIDVELVLRV